MTDIKDGSILKHINIPVFVPHLGCPNDCVFCNQRRITGHETFSIEDAKKSIDEVIFSPHADRHAEREIAFFGGSFTGIERPLMTELLELATSYCEKGLASGIRLSTRPDYISDEIISILSKYPVKTIELGIQSLSDRVLSASKRGHTADDSIRAMHAVKTAGFDLIGQMMVGLPLSTLTDELYTMTGICDCKADGVRIYPTVVFHKTELYDMMLLGKYQPISPKEASERVAELLYLAYKNDLPVIRVGLCESESLHSEDGLTAGAFHPALGEICFSAFFLKLFCARLDTLGDLSGRSVTISVARNMLSKAIGQKRSNAISLKEKYSLSKISFVTDENLSGYEFSVS